MHEMTKFFRKILILLIPVLLILALFEYKLGKIPNLYNTKRRSLENQLDSINVLVLGNSQPLLGVNPEYFSLKGFNLSNMSQSIFYDKELCLKYIDRMKNLKCVIINISYISLWYQLHDDLEEWRDYFYRQFWDIRYPGLKWYDSKSYSLLMLYTPQEAVKYATHLFREDFSENLNRNGWLGYDTLQYNTFISDSAGKARVKFHDGLLWPSRYAEIYSSLETLVDECRKHKAEVVFITTPVLPTYYNHTNPEIEMKNASAIKELCNKYGCTYFDYYRDNRFTVKDFYDNDHLNFVGAAKFSRIIDADIVSKLKQ
jgi:hypothetical protein